jgi:MFS transporter, DHA1 family, inner membrane transport protein
MSVASSTKDLPVGMALPGLVLAIALIGDALIYVVLPLYHQEFGVSLAMVGVLLSLNRWIRLLANSAVAHLGDRIGPHIMMIAAAAGSIVSTTLYGLGDGAGLQIFARCLWGVSFAALNLATLAYAVSDRPNAGKRVGLSRALMGVVQVMALIGGAWLCLNMGSRQVFVIFGAITSLALIAALLLPRLPREPTKTQGFRLPIPHRLEVWGFMLGFAGDGVFLLTLAFLMKDSFSGTGTSVAPVMATAILVALRYVVEITTGPLGGWIGDKFGARKIAILNGVGLVLGFAAIAAGHELLGALLVVTTRGMFNTLVPVLVIERGKASVLSSQASYSTWRDFGAAVGPLSAPWLFLNVPQGPLYGALAVGLAVAAWGCLVRR